MIKTFVAKKNRNFLRLWLAQIISQFGDRIHQLALVGFIAERSSGSAMGLAKLLTFTILPVFVIQPFAGVLIDRWDRRTTLFFCDIFRGLLVLSIPFVFIRQDSMIPIYVVVFLAFCFSRFYIPAKMSIIPDLVEDSSLHMANSMVSTTGMIASVIGFMIGSFLIESFGSRNGFIIDAGTFFVSGIIIFFMNIPRKIRLHRKDILKTGKEIVGPLRKSIWQETKEGLVYFIQHKEIRFIVDMMFALMAAAGAVYVVIIVFIQQSFNSITKDLGVLAVALGAGLFTGAMAYGKWGKRFVWYKTIFFCLTAGGLMLILFSLVVYHFPNLFFALAISFMWGVIIGPIFIASNTIIHFVSEDKMRGKMFSALEIVIHFAFLVAMLLSSWLAQFFEIVSILVTVGVLVSGVGIIGFARSKHHQAFWRIDR
jgi:MFS family permease